MDSRAMAQNVTLQQNQQEMQQQNQQVMQQTATRDQLESQADQWLQNNRMEAFRKRAEASRKMASRNRIVEPPTVFLQAEPVNNYQRKKRESAQTKINNAILSARAARQVVIDEEARALTVNGEDLYEKIDHNQLSEAERQELIKNERGVLEKKLKAIGLQEEARLMIADQLKERGLLLGVQRVKNSEAYVSMVADSKDGEWEDAPENVRVRAMSKESAERRRVLRIKSDSLAQQIRALDKYGQLLEPGSEEYIKIMKRKEAAVVQKAKLDKQRKVLGTWNETERTREQNTIDRHGWYDRAAAIVSKFRRPNPYSVEGAKIIHNGRAFVNIGRATFGGTKPMYRFKEVSTGKEFLFKEAVNCLGFYKPGGAVVTEIGSILQKTICGEESVDAFAVTGENGEMLGSLQEKIIGYDKSAHPADQREPVDLYKYQAKRQADPSASADGPDDLTYDERVALLREHVLDWALCNFDTKGENFMANAAGRLVSFDKEASFSKLDEEGAQHMDVDYKPHSNDTIYNTIFKDFQNNKMDLDLDAVIEPIQRLQSLSTEEYRNIFEPLLRQKCKTQEERDAMFQKIESRRADIVNEYKRFFGKLVQERSAAIRREGGAPDRYSDRLDENGLYRFPGERPEDQGGE